MGRKTSNAILFYRNTVKEIEKEHTFMSHFETPNMHDVHFEFLSAVSSAPSSAPVINCSSSPRPRQTSIRVCGWRGERVMYVRGRWCRNHRHSCRII